MAKPKHAAPLELARWRRETRAVIAGLPDDQLITFLDAAGPQAASHPADRDVYRMARHEALKVRGWLLVTLGGTLTALSLGAADKATPVFRRVEQALAASADGTDEVP